MRLISTLLVVMALVLMYGCSGGESPVVTPDNGEQLSKMSDMGNGVQVLLSGTMNLEDGTLDLSRESSGYLDVTSLVGGNFTYQINGMIPPDIIDLTLSLTNASPALVYDVNIVFSNLYGKKVMNPDSWTDIFNPGAINPFISFRKDYIDRGFPAGVRDDQGLMLKWPSGQSPLVDFFIIAHLPGNTGGVYQITDWNVLGTLNPNGSVRVEMSVLDHQGDITAVLADTRVFNNNLTAFTLKAVPVWEALIEDTNGVAPGDYNILVGSTSPATPAYITYNLFPISVVDDPGESKVTSIKFIEREGQDTWFDIAVQQNGFVYVVADHPSTGNVGGSGIDGTRTAIQFTNDLSSMEVMNPGTGLASPEPDSWDFTGEMDRIDVSNGGILITNNGGNGLGTWTVSGSTAISAACCWMYTCVPNVAYVPDVMDHVSTSFGSGVLGFGQTSEFCVPIQNWDLGFSDNNPSDYNSFNFSEEIIYPDIFSVAGVDGINGTNNFVVLYNDGNTGKLSILGDAYFAAGDLVEIMTTGTFGTGDGEFFGALDVTVDSNKNILTLESHGSGVFRFQKFDQSLNWLYSTPWIYGDSPARMDFDTGNNKLYVLTDAGVHICDVE